MPTLNIATNLKREQVPFDFLEKATNLLAEELGKPASVSMEYCTADFITGAVLAFSKKKYMHQCEAKKIKIFVSVTKI